MSRAIPRRDNLALLVLRSEAQEAKQAAYQCGLLDPERKIIVREGAAEIPVIGPLSGFELVCQRAPEFYEKTSDLAEHLQGILTRDEIDLLPRGWAILGDIITVKIHPSLDRHQHQIGSALLSIYPRCKSVLRDFGIEGQLREPNRQIIAGSGTETIHKENGIKFKLDVQRVMFSPGNMKERIRMSRFGCAETVVDMFAGIGYFTLPMAVHSRPRKIISIELNPVAYGYLQENIKLNHVEDVVEPRLGDCTDETPSGIADRVVMGFVGTTDRYLQTGIRALCPGGVLHYHQTVPSWLYPQVLVNDISRAAQDLGRQAEILRCIRVKKYSPGVLHAVVDARIAGE
ncbi:MAG TPA: class I SAM-dependent methyltransferase family protein [Methanotrichaceae archaeon]|nr:class I SAM-dependent methyltransferase family protein [Methanotrichaceae archaeon]